MTGYFVFEKVEDKTELESELYRKTVNPSTRTELRKYLDAKLKDGFKVKDFLIIRGREEIISAVKIVAEFETVES